MFDRVQAFVSDVGQISSESELGDAIAELAADLGFRYFALTHHSDVVDASHCFRLHNYPAGWEDWFTSMRLGASDPVHRASHLTSVGFKWSHLEDLIRLTKQDQLILDLARQQGIGEGFTVPAQVPGEVHGSCSFATAAGLPLRHDQLPLAQLAGAFAFEAARRLMRAKGGDAPPRLTDRQRECVIWAARGKSDWEIARILGLSHETVIQHLKQARDRYGVPKRAQLAVHTLFDGTIAFVDILGR